MRWDELFADLESQFSAAEQRELEREANELSRIETSQLALLEILNASQGSSIHLTLRNDAMHHGVLERVGEGWILVSDGAGSLLIPTAQIVLCSGLPLRVEVQRKKIRHTLQSALRAISRNRAEVVIDVETKGQHQVRGVIDQVGGDFVRVFQLADGVSRRLDNSQGAVLIPIVAITTISLFHTDAV